jgi:hypothetical protein
VVGALETLARQDRAQELQALVIGKWCDYGECPSTGIIDAISDRRQHFLNLKAIFLGDITCAELKEPWIQNCDLGPLLRAFPCLECLRVRGGLGLRFVMREPHDSLRTLILESSGLSRAVLHDLASCSLPNLVHLELWLGAKARGWNGTVDDLRPFLDGSRFPKLRHLGLRNSEIADQLALVVVMAPIMRTLETLDLSYGNISDFGGRALMGIFWDLPLKKLILNHHYLSGDMLKSLHFDLKCKVFAANGKDSNCKQRGIFACD